MEAAVDEAMAELGRWHWPSGPLSIAAAPFCRIAWPRLRCACSAAPSPAPATRGRWSWASSKRCKSPWICAGCASDVRFRRTLAGALVTLTGVNSWSSGRRRAAARIGLNQHADTCAQAAGRKHARILQDLRPFLGGPALPTLGNSGPTLKSPRTWMHKSHKPRALVRGGVRTPG